MPYLYLQPLFAFPLALAIGALCLYLGKRFWRRYRFRSIHDVDPFEMEDWMEQQAPYPPSLYRASYQQPALDEEFAPPDLPSPASPSLENPLAPPKPASSVSVCPKCKSRHVDTDNRARKAGGTIAGSAGALSYALSGARTGMTVGQLAGPTGMVVGGLTGAIRSGLVGGAIGCTAGATVGEVIDANIFDNYRCLSCGHRFSNTPSLS